MAGYTALGASAAVADYDGDGFEDIFVTDSKQGGKNHLYHNNGNFTFTDVAEKAGVANGNDAENASADALWFDFNNDGRPDLLVVRFGQNQLFENLGNGKFRDVTKAGRARPLHECHHGDRVRLRPRRICRSVRRLLLSAGQHLPSRRRRGSFPESFETANNGGGVTVFHNNGNGTFTDVTEKVGLQAERLDARPGPWRRQQRRLGRPLRGLRLRHRPFLRQQRRRHLHRQDRNGHRLRHQERHERRLGRFRQRRPARHLRHQHHRRLHARRQLPLAQQRQPDLHRRLAGDRHARHRLGLGRQSSSTTTTTAGSICT